MILVDGSLQDHSSSAAFVAELREGIATFAVDRRGFGASGDAFRTRMGAAGRSGQDSGPGGSR